MMRGPHDPGLWPEEILIGLGSNMGDRLKHLQVGIEALDTHPRISVVSTSRIFESEFVGDGVQDLYLNACLKLRTTLSPIDLLAELKALEQDRGRAPDSHMEPRPLDLDILFFGLRCFRSELLAVPHPRMKDRAFVLQPLAELVPSKKFPDSGETVARVCAKLQQENDNRLTVRADLYLEPDRPEHKEE
jgi:2-amino-4-hydroxy-6-hydroxymethyldihydropteridine diphosphokinase